VQLGDLFVMDECAGIMINVLGCVVVVVEIVEIDLGNLSDFAGFVRNFDRQL